jgi:hypothetical protein
MCRRGSATLGHARVLVPIVDKAAVLHRHTNIDASVLHGTVEEGRARIIAKLAERMDSRKARKLIELAERIYHEPFDGDGDERCHGI